MPYLCSHSLKIMETQNLRTAIAALILLCTGILFSAGCRKSNDQNPPDPPLMTIDFTNNYVNPKLGAIVFLSDPKGKVLADTSFTGNIKIGLKPGKGMATPPWFMVTVATWEPNMHNFTISINTWTCITGGNWVLRGDRHDTTGHITVSLNNLPVHSGPILFANSGFTNFTFNSINRVNNLYAPQDTLYLRLITPAGPKYKIKYPVNPGGNYDIAMNDLSDAAVSTITLPTTAVYYEARLWGFKPQTAGTPQWAVSWTTGSIQTEELLGDGIPTDSVKVSYPPATYSRYHTELSYTEDWTSNTTWFNQMNGEVPATFTKVDAHIAGYSSPSPGKVILDASGTWNLTTCEWEFYSHNNQIFEWKLNVPDSSRTITLPDMPPSMAKMFPLLALDSLTVSWVRLTNYDNIQSYQDIVNTLLNTATPVNPGSQNTRSCLKSNAK